ncbi:MAG TPA: hypothetical protein VMF67_07665 [Rhizomicrobium sp.]|nr:hypothetical protein [Rhizomicrobium sp.]
MPNAQTNPKINARRFAALLAGFDLGNGSEEEALAKARVLRRMAADAGMRLVDVMELPEVKRAIDDQLHPAREESPELRDALREAAALREELTERTRDVRELADLLRRREEEARTERKPPPAARPAPKPVPKTAAKAGGGKSVSKRKSGDSFWDDPVIGSIFYVVGWIVGILIAQHLCQRWGF